MKRIAIPIGIVVLLAGGFILLRQGRLHVQVSPPDTNLALEGDSFSGSTRLRPGRYQLTAQKIGYVPYSRVIDIRPFLSTNMSLHLKRIPDPRQLAAEAARGQFSLIGNNLRFLSTDGRFIKQAPLFSTPDGSRQLTTLTAELQPPLDAIHFNQDGFSALIRRGSLESQFSFDRTDLLHQTERALDKNLSQASWSSDGKRGAAIRTDAGQPLILVIFDSTFMTSQKEIILSDLTQVSRLSWLPDGSGILLLSGNALNYVDLATKEIHPLATTPYAVSDFQVSPDGTVVALATGPQEVRLLTLVQNPFRFILLPQAIPTALNKTTLDEQNNLLAAIPGQGSDQLRRFRLGGQIDDLYYTSQATFHPTSLLWQPQNKELYFMSGNGLYAVSPEEANAD